MHRRIVVAGGSGFIGRHLVAELCRAGHVVRVADNLSLGAATLHPSIEMVAADLRDQGAARQALAGEEVCILLAARSAGIGYFNKHPAEMLDDNVRILSSVFNAAIAEHVRQIIYISSSCIFDNSPAHPITEDALETSPPPSTGYPFSKLVGEFYCKAYAQQYGLRFTILRPFNVYGPGELPGKEPGDSHVIPDLALKLYSGQDPLEIFGDGQQTRCFTHIDDITRGIIRAVDNENALNCDFNLGHPFEISILHLAEKMWYLSGRKSPFAFKSVPGFAVDVRRRAVDSSRAMRLLDWKPVISLEEGLTAYLGWFLNGNIAKYKNWSKVI